MTDSTGSAGGQPPILERGKLRWSLIITLILVAFVLRFHMLGIRAMSHDESLHAYFSYVLYSKGTYQHDPIMHGPLLFHMNSLVFWLLFAWITLTCLSTFRSIYLKTLFAASFVFVKTITRVYFSRS